MLINNDKIYKLRDWIDINKIEWSSLSLNINAIGLLKENLSKIYWDNLSENINAIEILKENQDKINWYYLSENPSIFEYNYKYLYDKCSIYREELFQKIFHPKRVLSYLELGYNLSEDKYISEESEDFNSYFKF